ncbi:YacL family protein [Vibrio cholerae]
MEFEFIKNTLLGDVYVRSSMGHEVFGRWLQEEIGQDLVKLDSIDQLLASAKAAPQQEFILEGREISLTVQGDEVLVEENSLKHDFDLGAESEFELYESESRASCGLEDFEQLLDQWKSFLRTM